VFCLQVDSVYDPCSSLLASVWWRQRHVLTVEQPEFRGVENWIDTFAPSIGKCRLRRLRLPVLAQQNWS